VSREFSPKSKLSSFFKRVHLDRLILFRINKPDEEHRVPVTDLA